MNKNKISIIILLVLVIVTLITFVFLKLNNNEKNNANEAVISDEVTIETEDFKEENKIDSEIKVEDSSRKDVYTEEEIKESKFVATDFVSAISTVDSERPLVFPKEATKYTVDSLSKRIMSIAENEKPKVYRREVTEIAPLKSTIEEETKEIIWDFAIRGEVYNEKGRNTARERGNIMIMVVKKGKEFKVAEYSINTVTTEW